MHTIFSSVEAAAYQPSGPCTDGVKVMFCNNVFFVVRFAAAGVMLSCLVNAVQRPVKKCDLLPDQESTLTAVPQTSENGYSLTSSSVHSANEELYVYKSSFFSQLGLEATQSSVSDKRSEIKERSVIVIDDDDDDDDDDNVPLAQYSCVSDLFGTARSLRGDVEGNGSATSRLLQPYSRLRKLLSIDISSPLGSRTLQHVMSTLKNDVMPLNPYTVSHSLAGSDNTLDYGTFCRTPVKSKFSGRLRQREFPVRYRQSASTHYHYYCFNRADRRRFCQRFDTGLSGRSRRLRRIYDHCNVAIERITADEISDWRSSQRLRDYVKRMDEKEKAAAAVMSSRSTATDEVICLSSDSEDEVSSPVKKQDLMFRCHQCDIQLPCGVTFRNLIREHYRTYHGIVNIDIVRTVHADGSTSMQVVHVPPPNAQRSAVASVSLSGLDTCSSASTQNGSSVYLLQPTPSQSGIYPVSCSVPSQVQFVEAWPVGAGDSMAATSVMLDEMQADAHTAASQRHSPSLTQLKHNMKSRQTTGRPVAVPRQLFYRNSALLNGGAMCCDADSPQSSPCDADVICLD